MITKPSKPTTAATQFRITQFIWTLTVGLLALKLTVCPDIPWLVVMSPVLLVYGVIILLLAVLALAMISQVKDGDLEIISKRK